MANQKVATLNCVGVPTIKIAILVFKLTIFEKNTIQADFQAKAFITCDQAFLKYREGGYDRRLRHLRYLLFSTL